MYLITLDRYIKRVANKIYTSKDGVDFVYCHDNTTMSVDWMKNVHNIDFVIEDISKDEAYKINCVDRKDLPTDPAKISFAVLVGYGKQYTEHGFIAWFKNLFKRA